jgi:glycerol-3-phosphate acyltransferase PlsX
VIAVDSLGGDDAPRAVVEGAVEAARSGVAVVLVGPADQLRDELSRLGASDLSTLTIEDAPDGVAMEESPLAALRRKPRASIRVACELAASGAAAGVYSAGHTGASLLAAHGAFGLLPGVERPALAVLVPTRRGSSVLLDAGANVDCRPSHLAQFAVMGAAYARVLAEGPEPRVALLSIGEEAGKGNELTKDAHAALSAMPINFIGNIDAAQWFHGEADVVVCDGFTGNIALKVGEAVVELVAPMLGDEARKRLHYAESGGAPLIGVNGLLVVGHGRSNARAIANGIALTSRLARGGVVTQVAEAISRVLK